MVFALLLTTKPTPLLVEKFPRRVNSPTIIISLKQEGTKFIFTVSKGSEEIDCVVPNILRLTKEQAREKLEENGYMLELIPLPELPPIFQKTQSQKEDKKARKKKKEQDRYRRSRSKEKISRRLDKERKDKEKLKAVK